MARSTDIVVLAFHNFRVGRDSIVCKYDKSNMDQAGDKECEAQILMPICLIQPLALTWLVEPGFIWSHLQLKKLGYS